MRTRNAIERLAAVAPPEPLLDAGEEDRILQRILGSDHGEIDDCVHAGRFQLI